MANAIYSKSTRELVKEFVKAFVPPQSGGSGLTDRRPLADGGGFHAERVHLLVFRALSENQIQHGFGTPCPVVYKLPQPSSPQSPSRWAR